METERTQSLVTPRKTWGCILDESYGRVGGGEGVVGDSFVLPCFFSRFPLGGGGGVRRDLRHLRLLVNEDPVVTQEAGRVELCLRPVTGVGSPRGVFSPTRAILRHCRL